MGASRYMTAWARRNWRWARAGWPPTEAPAGTSPNTALLAAIRAPVADVQVIGNAHMTRQDYVVADPGAPRDADPRHDQAAFADLHIVADLDQVIQFGAAPDDSVVDTPPVDTGVGADLDLVLQNAAAHVGNPRVPLAVPEVAEAITADYRARLEHHAIADPAARHSIPSRADDGVLAHRYTVTQRGMRPLTASERRPERSALA